VPKIAQVPLLRDFVYARILLVNTAIAAASHGPPPFHRSLVMTKLLLLPVLFGLIAVAGAGAAQQSDEDAAIRKRHDEWCEAWNKHDPKAMAAFWVADGDLINPFGKHAKGTAEIEQLFTEEQSGPMAGTTYSGTVESIRYIGDVAIVDVAGEITGMKGPDGAAAPPFKHHVTWIARKVDGKWMAEGARAFGFIHAPAPGSAQPK
jgi:uncharacterized protein (TIGR02246 family)